MNEKEVLKEAKEWNRQHDKMVKTGMCVIIIMLSIMLVVTIIVGLRSII